MRGRRLLGLCSLPDGMNMKRAVMTVATVAMTTFGGTQAFAECQMADAKLEEAILQKPELQGRANRQKVRDLRSLRDAAFTLWSYGRHVEWSFSERSRARLRPLDGQNG